MIGPSQLITQEQRIINGQKSITDDINIELLKKREPILWHCSIVLFEDELNDHGVSKLTLQARVMPSCFLLLLRFWLRVDDVLYRVYET
eukprot:UN08702